MIRIRKLTLFQRRQVLITAAVLVLVALHGDDNVTIRKYHYDHDRRMSGNINSHAVSASSSTSPSSSSSSSSSVSVQSSIYSNINKNNVLRRLRQLLSPSKSKLGAKLSESEGALLIVNSTSKTSPAQTSVLELCNSPTDTTTTTGNHTASYDTSMAPTSPIHTLHALPFIRSSDRNNILSGLTSFFFGGVDSNIHRRRRRRRRHYHHDRYEDQNSNDATAGTTAASSILFVLFRNTVRYGLLFYAVFELSKMLLEEVNQSLSTLLLQQQSSLDDDIGPEDDDEIGGGSGDSSGSSRISSTYSQEQPPAYRKYYKQIHQMIHFLDTQQQQRRQQHNVTRQQKDGQEDEEQKQQQKQQQFYESLRSSTSYQEIYQLAQLLHSAGIPYRNQDANITTATVTTTTTSVETLLMQLSHAEISLLQQCLYKIHPPDSNVVIYSNDDKRNKSDTDTMNDKNNIRRNLVGVESIYEQILNTIQQQLSYLPNKRRSDIDGNDDFRAEDPFASLFHNSIASSSSSSSSTPSSNNIGILLFGPPGCGKTNLIRTLVHTLQVPCLIITPSVLLRKYVGETNLHIRTLFNMIQDKLVPCIVCIDELDGLFRERSHDTEHEVNRELKTELLQWMDGMMTTTKATENSGTKPMIIIGATNRPFDVDAAILRRLSHTYFIGLPNRKQRHELFTLLLETVPHAIQPLQLSHIVAATSGYTPSDIRQLLQAAALSGPMKRRRRPRDSSTNDDHRYVEKLRLDDILNAMSVIGPTPLGIQYRQQMEQFRSQRQTNLYGGGSSSKNSNMMYMNDDDDDDNYDGHDNSNTSYDSNSLFFLDRTNVEKGKYEKWETIFGNYYNLGTLEIDQSTLDILTNYISHLQQEQQCEDDRNDDIDEDNDDAR